MAKKAPKSQLSLFADPTDRVVEMRAVGYRWSEISKDVGIEESQAQKLHAQAIPTRVMAIRAIQEEDIVRTYEMERKIKSQIESGDLRAIRLSLALIDQRHKILSQMSGVSANMSLPDVDTMTPDQIREALKTL